MKILAINGTYRKKGTTTDLTEAALGGAASAGAEAEMVLLQDHDVRYCTNCLMCYKDLDSEIAPCSVNDSVGEILQKVMDADGIILSSPVHNGFITGLMTVFFERITWRLCRSTGKILNLRGMPEPRSQKVRALATIVSAGQMPTKQGKKYCNDGTPFMKQNGCLIFNADWVGAMYAGGEFSKKLQADDWQKAYLFKELSKEQLKEARDLGIKMAGMIKTDRLRPPHPLGRFGPFLDTVTGWFLRD
jgi:multimeric flavodoxin WrbA